MRFAVLGNPVVDAIAKVEPSFLEHHHLRAGDTNILSLPTMMQLGSAVDVDMFRSGGAGANVAYTLSRIGYPTCFMGPLGVDPSGRHFFKEMLDAGLTMTTPHETYRTTEVFIFLTPDGTRTMAQPEPLPPSADDAWVEEPILTAADWLVVEGYVARDWPKAVETAFSLAPATMKKVLLLPAPQVCSASAGALWKVVEAGIHLMIGNTHEYEALLTHATPAQQALLAKTPHVETHSGEAAVFHDGQGGRIAEPTQRVETPTDNTGAGDAFAAGFLASYTTQPDVAAALRKGHLLGGAVVACVGPRLPNPMAVWMTADTQTNLGI